MTDTDASLLARLQEIETRAAKATEGPWTLLDEKLRPEFPTRIFEVQADDGAVVKWGGFDGLDRKKGQIRADAQFITHAREDIPYLLDALRRSGEALRRLQEDKDTIERELRELWWMGHGCVTALYGDDGEMQCGRHCLDFKRMPLDELREEVRKIKWQRLVESAALRQSGAEGTEAGGRSHPLAPID